MPLMIFFYFQDISNSKEDGFYKLQEVLEKSNLVLPNTSSRGKDKIRQDIQNLQQEWDTAMVKVKF